MLQLSEHLYPLDEVVVSFVQSVLSKRTIKECLYWLMELYTSTTTVVDSLLCLYHLFFAVGNKGLDGYIIRKIRHFITEPNNISPLADIVCALRVSQPSVDTLLLYYAATSETYQTRIYKTPATKSRFAGLIRSVYHSDHSNAGTCLRIASSASSLCGVINELVNHFKIPILETSEYGEQDIIYTCAMIACAMPQSFASTPPINFVRAPPYVVEEIVHHFKSEPKRAWLKLTHRRLYPTHSTVLGRPNGMTYSRYEVDDLASLCWYSWEYYCYESRLWNERFTKYNGVKDDASLSVVFKDDDALEDFYDDGNAMDFDEQPYETQMMSLHPLNIISDPKIWFQNQIEERMCVSLVKMKI